MTGPQDVDSPDQPARRKAAKPPAGKGTTVAIGTAVLAGWLVLFYAGLAWFRRAAGR